MIIEDEHKGSQSRRNLEEHSRLLATRKNDNVKINTNCFVACNTRCDVQPQLQRRNAHAPHVAVGPKSILCSLETRKVCILKRVPLPLET